MNILIYVNRQKDHQFVKTKKIIKYLTSHNVIVYLTPELVKYFEGENIYSFQENIVFDCLLILGGDGTFLSALHQYYHFNIPCIGINFGRVGYLSAVDKNDYHFLLEQIINRQYEIEEKKFLLVKLISEGQEKEIVAFNEAVIHRGMSMKMVKMRVNINNEWINNFYADGLIVSTSMGSSAYNLSAGGPLLLPQAACFVLTAICSQSGIMPSIVVSDQDTIQVSNDNQENNDLVVTIDGREQFLVKSKITIEQFKRPLKIINIKDSNIKENHIEKIFSGYIK